ncbi:MAG TPA: SLC13 family permease [Gaiellaceae bacterium]|nr:SLC13 family permease [Gaiellaceae bacterium]
MSNAVLQAARQDWPPFVLVAGLLAIGVVVEADGLFAAVGARVERIGGSPFRLLAAVLALDAVVTALLNLDTAAVFVTPIVVHAARQRRCDERPFLYGALFVANGASVLLPGSNLTNLIVLAHERLSGAAVFEAMALPWLATVALCVALLAFWYRPRSEDGERPEAPPLRLGVGALATLAATGLILGLENPALPVLGVGVVAVVWRRLRPRIDLPVLAGLFVVAVALGTLGRRWHGPIHLLAHLDGVGTAAVAAGASVVVNNLPAASLLSAERPPHPLPLLLGLDLGPNLAVTGSLAAYLWYRAARGAGARPSLVQVSLLGIVLVPLTLAAALAALSLTHPAGG